MLLGKIQIVCLSIIILINFADNYRRNQRRRSKWYEVKQYSMAKQRPRPRIIGGNDAMPGEAPWQVALSGPNGYICSGALVKTNVVITAAHCIATKQYDGSLSTVPNNGVVMYVDYGGLNRSNMHHRTEVTQFYFAPNYIQGHDIDNPPTDYDDIAILQLKDRVEESEHVKFIEISDRFPEFMVCEMAQITGWGHCEPGFHEEFTAPQRLQIIWMKIISRQRCNEVYPDLPDIGTNYFCAKCDKEMATICHGDSGGPVVIEDKLVGVISSSVNQVYTDPEGVESQQCALNSPAFLISTKKMLPWIEPVLELIEQDDTVPQEDYTYEAVEDAETEPPNPVHDENKKKRRKRLNRLKINKQRKYRRIPKSVVPYTFASRQHFISNIPSRNGLSGVTDAPASRSLWQISMVTKKYGETVLHLNHYCGGAIIGKRLAITSSHCIYRLNAFYDQLYIRYGGLSLNTLREMNKVLGWYIPDNTEPDCPVGTHDVDFALLELEDDVIETSFTEMIPIKKDSLNNSDQLGGITGWGTFGREDNDVEENILQTAIALFPTREECIRRTRPPIGDYDHCVTLSFASACMSDHGGPIIIFEEIGWKLAGVLSRAKKGCDEHFREAVFVELNKVRKWIDDTVRLNHLTPPQWA